MSLNQERDVSLSLSRLRPKTAVGTVSTSVNFPPHVTAFKPSDVPEFARHAVQEVKSMLARDKDKLQVSKVPWNSATFDTSQIRCVRKSAQLAKHDMPLLGQTYNYRAEVLPPKMSEYTPSSSKHCMATTAFLPNNDNFDANSSFGQSNNNNEDDTDNGSFSLASGTHALQRSRSLNSSSAGLNTNTWGRVVSPKTTERLYGEMCVHPSLSSAPKWDGTKQVSPKLHRHKARESDAQARRNSMKQSRRLLFGSRKKGKKGKGGYISPERKLRRQLRERQKILQSPEREEYLRKVRTGTLNPRPPHRPRLKLATKRKKNKIKIYLHSGVWEMNKATGKMHWSDTGSEEYDSPGDIVKVVNKDAYCFGHDGPNEY